MTIKDNRKEYDKLFKQVKELKDKPYVAIGVVGGGGGDFGLVEYATANEFGTLDNGGFTPERSYIRSTMDEKANDYKNELEKKKLGVLLRKITVKNVLGLFGLRIQADIQKKITDLNDPPNAESTIKEKGSSNPLINTGRLRQSISWKLGEK